MSTEPESPAPGATEPSAALEAEPPAAGHGNWRLLALGALGVVYGDIGTSPLYALRECFHEDHALTPNPETILGLLSLFFWSMTLVVVIKYLTFILKADNRGDGGVLALLALAQQSAPRDQSARVRFLVVLIGLIGAALLIADGIITPAISVLSAVEGLAVATPLFSSFVVPITLAILIALFAVQRRGTSKLGALFGPIMLLWFTTLAALGAPWIWREPRILAALNPLHAIQFIAHGGWHAFLSLGAVVLCITGGEALYADMGHFGRRPIRIAWYTVVFPALLINYFGQGAMLLQRGPAALEAPFYQLGGTTLLYPLVILATMATIIASQALISGVYSLAQQAVQLGFAPRLKVLHTSGDVEGQIYMPAVNAFLLVSCLAAVVSFQTSSALAAAYGVSVTGTMLITTLLFMAVARHGWGWSPWWVGSLGAGFLVIDLAFLGANLPKFLHGAWVPMVVAGLLVFLMRTWAKGRRLLSETAQALELPLDRFLVDVAKRSPVRVPGTAVFLTALTDSTPRVVLHHFKHNKVLHEKVVLLTVMTEKVPKVAPEARVEVMEYDQGFYRIIARYGFAENPHVPEVIRRCRRLGLELHDVSYFLGRNTLLTTGHSRMSRFRKALFALMVRNGLSADAFFGLPPNRVVEMGTQVEI